MTQEVTVESVSREVHALLALDCSRAILEVLEGSPGGLSDRQISVKVGADSTEKTIVSTRRKLTEAGWIGPINGPPRFGSRAAAIWILTGDGGQALTYAREGDRIRAPGQLPVPSPGRTRAGPKQ